MTLFRRAKIVSMLAALYLIGCATAYHGKMDAEELYHIGKNLYQNYKYKEAIAVFDDALSADPNNVKIIIRKGLSWHKLGEYEKAIFEYDKAIRIDHKNKAAWNNKGNSLHHKGNYVDAIECFNKSLDINPVYAVARVGRARTFFVIGKYAAAHQDNDLAIEIKPKLAVAYNNKAWFLATCPNKQYRNGKKALEVIQKAISLGPPTSAYLNTKAAVLAELGKYDQAIITNRQAIELLKKEKKEHEIDYFKACSNAFMANRPWRATISEQKIDIPALSDLDTDLHRVDLYRLKVALQVNKNWKYDKNIDSEPSQITSIAFSIMPDGEIKNIVFTKRSGNKDLDKSGFNAITKTSPTEPFPDNIRRPFIEMGLRFGPDGVK